MSDLSAQLSAFKSKIRSGPSVAARRSVNPSGTPNGDGNSTSNIKDFRAKQAHKREANDSSNNVVKRQRLPNDFSGSMLPTQLHTAVEYVKQHDYPIPVSKLQAYMSLDVAPTLLPLLKEIDRIKYDPNEDTLEYVSFHNIRSADDLLNFLRFQPTFKGIAVKELSDGWAGSTSAINELEKENKILVLRNKKENAPRLVWANLGGDPNQVDEEFREMWSGVKLPEPEDLYHALIDQGLKPSGTDPALLKKKPKQPEKKQKKARRGKITNTHVKLKDYSQLV